MSHEHKQLAAGRWEQLSFLEQMANIGSEVERALNWQIKNNLAYREKASIRALELTDLALEHATTFPRRRELARLRESLVDYFFCDDEFKASEASWRKYFFHFTYAARKKY
jgi:hypothetical protein